MKHRSTIDAKRQYIQQQNNDENNRAEVSYNDSPTNTQSSQIESYIHNSTKNSKTNTCNSKNNTNIGIKGNSTINSFRSNNENQAQKIIHTKDVKRIPNTR